MTLSMIFIIFVNLYLILNERKAIRSEYRLVMGESRLCPVMKSKNQKLLNLLKSKAQIEIGVD
jgi:hypothetical protein